MSDASAMLEQFGNYARILESKGRRPSDEDIDIFLDKFFDSKMSGFPFEGGFLYTAGKNKDDGSPLYDVKNKSYKELIAEAKPIIESKVLEMYSSIEESIEAHNWDTVPRPLPRYAQMLAREMGATEFDELPGVEKLNHKAHQKAVVFMSRVNYRIKKYFQTALPFMLRHSMYHNIGTIRYSTQYGDNQLTPQKGESFRITSEESLQEFLNNKKVGKMVAGQDQGLRSLFWVPSDTGRNIKLGVLDIDNPAKLSPKDLKAVVKKIHTALSNQGHPTIIMFTGASYHIWFGGNDEGLGDAREVNEYLRGMLGDYGSFDEPEAIDLKIPFIDLSINRPGAMVRMFFSLHYPPAPNHKKNKDYTGLAAIPVAPTDLDKFDPVRDAHPEAVLRNFQAYSEYVSKFFDLIGIGQDHESPEDLESPPLCLKLPKKYPTHTLLKSLYDRETINNVQYKNIEAKFSGESKVIAYSQARGLGAVLVYDPTGTSGPTGTSTTRIIHGVAKTRPAHTYYITRQGTVVYDDYICREFERFCEAKKIRSAILAGHIIVAGGIRGERDRQAAISILNRRELSPLHCRTLRFITSKVTHLNGDKIPMEIMEDQVKEIHTKRIQGTTYYELSGNVGPQLKTIFMDLQKGRKSGAMIVEGDERYLITATRTINLVVLGMKKGKAYDSNEAPPLYVGVAKRNSKYGTAYHMVGLAQIALPKADRIRLRKLIEGEDGRNVIPVGKDHEDLFVITQPAIVVEVIYDDISPQLRNSLPFIFTKNRYRRMKTRGASVTPLINAKVIAIREDLNPERIADISARQDPMIEISSKPINKASSLLGALPNPSGPVEFVRRNSAFFGVPKSLDTYVGDYYSEIEGKPMGGRRVQIPLIGPGPRYRGERLPGEVDKAFQRFRKGEEGYKVYVEPRSLVKSTDTPYYRITSLGGEYEIAKDDQRGSGADGNLVTSFNSQIQQVNNYGEMVNEYELSNKEQEIEDIKVVATMLSSDQAAKWHDPDSEVQNYRHEDKEYIESYKNLNKSLAAALRKTAMDKPTFDKLAESVLENPKPLKADQWEKRVDEHIEDFNKWDERPQPKESWESYFMGLGASWEVPLLEKERLLRIATEEHGLTDSEVDQIDMNYSTQNFEALSESILAELYEVPEDDGEEF